MAMRRATRNQSFVLSILCFLVLAVGLCASHDSLAHVVPTDGLAEELVHWLNTKTNTRHNAGCRYFKNTKEGRLCRPNEGTACKICGG